MADFGAAREVSPEVRHSAMLIVGSHTVPAKETYVRLRPL